MSPVKFKERKLKEEEETLEIIKEQKTLETKKKKKKKCELESNKGNFEAIEEELPVEKNTVDKMNLQEKKKKQKKSKLGLKNKDVKMMQLDGVGHEDENQEDKGAKKEKIRRLGSKKKKRRESGNDVNGSNEDQIHVDEHVEKEEIHRKQHLADYGLESDHAKISPRFQALVESRISEKSGRTKIKTKKVKDKGKHKRKDSDVSKRSKSEEILGAVEEKVEEIQFVDEDCSRGMKKWLIQYKERRPGLKVLQERIDDFITTHEERQEQERKEKEAQAAEGGWTVVVHHKGRKKTTDTETGVTVGSVAQAAVVDKMGKKKSKEVPLNFYRFQKREAQRNEVMMLRSKFEQDKKRIQQLRAARKFRPY